MPILLRNHARVAQMVEQLICNQLGRGFDSLLWLWNSRIEYDLTENRYRASSQVANDNRL